MTQTYAEFLEKKSQLGGMSGFEPVWMPEFLFDFQRALVEWAIRKGRAAIFADCGLGKTPMQLVWAENVVRKTNRPVLILTPLAVSSQTVREADKFGIDCRRIGDQHSEPRIYVTNYERLHQISPDGFAGVVCDESSILKNFLGVRRKAITEFLKKMRYRLLCTATAAPNDYVELGTSSEAIGDLGHMDMLARFFKNDDKTIFLMGTKYGDITQKGWRFKAHSERSFWRWVCSWAMACRRPSDLGFDDDGFQLPELRLYESSVKAKTLPPGWLYEPGASSLDEQNEEQKRTIPERCELAASLVDHDRPAVAWCHRNPEGDLLEKLIPDAEQLSGADSDERKEEIFAAFAAGQVRVLVTKPKIGGFGLNWQHCAHQTFFPSHSFEQWYQSVRRSWRFGQKHPVTVDIVTSEGAEGTMNNLKRKAAAAEKMFSELVKFMTNANAIGRSIYGNTEALVPSWL